MYKPKNIIVIGGNAAGPAAAAKARRINPDAKVILFEQGEYISTGTCEIPYVFSGEINSINEIVFFTPESFYKEKGVEVYIHHRVEQIDRRNKSILVKNLKNNSQNKYNYDSLILATGSTARKIPSFSSELENVFYLKSVKDLIRLKEFISENNVKTAAVIGSGFIGLEMAEAFHLKNIEPILIEKESLPFPQGETEIQHLLKEILIQKNVQFYGNMNEIKQFTENQRIRTITLDGRRVDVDIVLVAAGVMPNNAIGLQCRLETGRFGGLKVDKRLRTSDPFIYAAGDNVEMVNFVSGKPDYFPFATIAHSSGHIAGENAAGGNAFADPVIKNSAVKVFENSLISVGLSSKEAELYGFIYGSVSTVAPNKIKVMPDSTNIFGKIIFDRNTKKILGASFLGGKEVSAYGDIISALILSKTDVKLLSKINYNYTPPLSPFINILSILGKKINF